MEAAAFRSLQEQIADLQSQLRMQRSVQQQTTSALEQVPLPETVSMRRPAPSNCYDSEDINRWLDKMENYLALRRIDFASRTAQAELVTRLAGPAEDFYYSLPPDQKSSYAELQNSLRERFANDHQIWIIWQAVTTHQQGAIEPLDAYLTDLTNKFRRLNITDAEKMRYFVQGLPPEVRETVLLRQPKSFREAEEIARLPCDVKTTMNSPMIHVSHYASPLTENTSHKVLLTKLEEMDKKLRPVKAEPATTDASSKLSLPTTVAYLDGQPAVDDIPASRSEIQQLHEMIKELGCEIKSPGNSKGGNIASLAAFSEPTKLQDIIHELRRIEEKMEENNRRTGARINGLARRNPTSRDDPPRQRTREEQPTQRTREGQPICYNCGRVGHSQQNCNQRFSQGSSNSGRY